jgi:hypothetical protein
MALTGSFKAVKRKRLMVCATARNKTFFFNCKNKIDRIPLGWWVGYDVKTDQPLTAVALTGGLNALMT